MLALGLKQQAFLDEWGQPTRTSVTTDEEVMTIGLNAYGGNFFKGGRYGRLDGCAQDQEGDPRGL